MDFPYSHYMWYCSSILHVLLRENIHQQYRDSRSITNLKRQGEYIMKKTIWIILGIVLVLGLIGHITEDKEKKQKKEKVNIDYLYSICERLQSSLNVMTFKPCRISPSSDGELMKIKFDDPIDFGKVDRQFLSYSPSSKVNDDNFAAPLIIGMAKGAGFKKVKLEYGRNESLYNLDDFKVGESEKRNKKK